MGIWKAIWVCLFSVERRMLFTNRQYHLYNYKVTKTILFYVFIIYTLDSFHNLFSDKVDNLQLWMQYVHINMGMAFNESNHTRTMFILCRYISLFPTKSIQSLNLISLLLNLKKNHRKIKKSQRTIVTRKSTIGALTIRLLD